MLGASKRTKENADLAVLYVLFYVFGVSEFIGALFEQ